MAESMMTASQEKQDLDLMKVREDNVADSVMACEKEMTNESMFDETKDCERFEENNIQSSLNLSLNVNTNGHNDNRHLIHSIRSRRSHIEGKSISHLIIDLI